MQVTDTYLLTHLQPQTKVNWLIEGRERGVIYKGITYISNHEYTLMKLEKKKNLCYTVCQYLPTKRSFH